MKQVWMEGSKGGRSSRDSPATRFATCSSRAALTTFGRSHEIWKDAKKREREERKEGKEEKMEMGWAFFYGQTRTGEVRVGDYTFRDGGRERGEWRMRANNCPLKGERRGCTGDAES